MAKVLVIAEHKKGNLKKASLELLTAAQGNEAVGIIFGSSASAAAEELAKNGVTEVFWVKDANFDHYHPEAYAAAVEAVIQEQKPQFILATASSLGKDLLPKLSARFDAPLVSDCTVLSLEASGAKAKRPFFSGKAMADVSFEAAPLTFISLRPNSLAAGALSGTGKVTEKSVTFDFAGSPIQFVSMTEAASDRPDLTEASIIVSGGRSLKTKENFKILFDLADQLGAAVGASRAAVDENLASHDMQVGQTGKTVNPSLYMAFGISGAIQHLAGMRTSKVIVAVNKDPQAPLFQKADYGVVGDLFTLAPLITQEVKKLKS
jgi:electron transfer flavoprotein alpha subunit